VDISVPPRDDEQSVTVAGSFAVPDDLGWPYGPIEAAPEQALPEPVRLVPYHRWARRGPSTMRVWLPRS
jgi:hypothetical protein